MGEVIVSDNRQKFNKELDTGGQCHRMRQGERIRVMYFQRKIMMFNLGKG